MLEKGIDAVGKSSIVAIPISEAAQKLGLVIDVDTFQFISACGVITLIVDRAIRLYWAAKDRKKEQE
jgi:uncharacterized membrane protein (DUF373 family)